MKNAPKVAPEAPLTITDLATVMSGVAGVVSAVAIIVSTAFAVFMYALVRKNAKQSNALVVLRDFENDRDVIQETQEYRNLLRDLNLTEINAYADALAQYAQASEKYSDKTSIILSVLNRYEFIAVGIRTGAIDEKLIKLWTRTSFVRTIAILSGFIKIRQMESSCAFSELHWLAYKWSTDLPEYRKVLEEKIPKPQIREIWLISPLIRAAIESWFAILLIAFQTIILLFIL